MSEQPLMAIVGTDTGVGKTVLGAGLIQSLRAAGLRVAAFKPVETGLVQGRLPGDSGAADWELLARASGQDPRSCLGQSFELPAAPLAAARHAGRPVDSELIESKLKALSQNIDCLVVEGAGGLCVPFTDEQLWADVLQRWRPQCLVVGRLGLGTVNHTLLTLSELRRREIPVLGVVLNTLEPEGPETHQTPVLIEEFGRCRVWSVIPEGCVAPAAVAKVLQDGGLTDRLISRYKSD